MHVIYICIDKQAKRFSFDVSKSNTLSYLFQKPQMRPMIAEYDPKKKGVRNDLSDVVMVK